MENQKMANTPYDDVFRTLLNDCTPLIIPVINDVFGEQYSGNEEIIFSPNEHFLNRQGGNGDERITDSSFQIRGKEIKRYHPECQSSPDSSLLVRFFEYGTQIALDEGEIRGGEHTYGNASAFRRAFLKMPRIHAGHTENPDRDTRRIFRI